MVRVVEKKYVARVDLEEDEPEAAPQAIGFVRKPPLGWIWAGLLIGAAQLIAVWIHGPIEVLPDFISLEAGVIGQVAPAQLAAHPLLKDPATTKFGFGGWFVVGIALGAALAALFSGRWSVRHNSAWWEENQGLERRRRYGFVLLGGVLVMFGAHLAHGCTSAHFLSGWSQLSIAFFPFTIAMISCAILAARLFHPAAPPIER